MIPTRDWALALVLACGFAFTGLGNHPLRASDEPRVAGIAWEMQHEGQIVPHLGGEPFLEHPPLYYAFLGAVFEHLGASDATARLPGAVASALTLLLVFALGARVANPAVGLAAILALVGMSGFFRYSHRVVVDPLLMLFVMAGYAAYVCAVWRASRVGERDEPDERVRGPWIVGVYLAAACAFWVKGPVGVIVVAGPIAIDVLASRRWRVLFAPAHLLGLPLLLAACAAWPLLLHRELGMPGLETYVVQNGLYRIFPSFGASAYVGGHAHPPWYYLSRGPDMVGWVLVFVPATAAWLARRGAPAGWRLPALRFLAWVMPVGTLLLTIPGTKRSVYLLPFLPPLAIAVGAWLVAAASEDARRSRVEAFVCRLSARVVVFLGRPASILIPAWSDTRADVQRSSTGACRAPQRAAQLGFAVSMLALVVVVPRIGLDRDLGPIARAIGEEVGGEHFAGYSLDEAMLGALRFYAGAEFEQVRSPAQLAATPSRAEARFLLAPLFLDDEVKSQLGPEMRVVRTWQGGERDYRLYELAEPAPRIAPVVDTSLAPLEAPIPPERSMHRGLVDG